MYAKLENNRLISAPSEVRTESQIIYNPPSEMLTSMGYKEVVYPTEPTEPTDPIYTIEHGSTVESYTEDADHIYVTYIPAPLPLSLDLEQLREAAYRAEADQYLIAHEGYILEGKTDEAELQKDLYLSRKAEIRERFNETI